MSDPGDPSQGCAAGQSSAGRSVAGQAVARQNADLRPSGAAGAMRLSARAARLLQTSPSPGWNAIDAGPSATGARRDWQLGDLLGSYGAHGPGIPPSSGAALLIPVGQPLCLDRGRLQQILRPPFDLLYLPSEAKQAQHSGFHGWCLTFETAHLKLASADRHPPAAGLHDLQCLQALQPQQDEQRQLSTCLRQLLNLVTEAAAAGRFQLEQAGLEPCILRLMAGLLCSDPTTLNPSPAAPSTLSREEMFDELVLWIRTHLHQPIRLEDLEQRSGYSQRSLRNFFQKRFGCAPVEWIRSQRLSAARERLIRPAAGETVSQIANRFGYTNLAHFSRDFHRAHGIPPSQLLRQGRRDSLTEQNGPSPAEPD